MKHIFTLLVLPLLICQCTGSSQSKKAVFSFHLFVGPQHLDPALLRGSSASYFFYNTLRGIYRIDEKNHLVSEGGACQWITEKLLHCRLKRRQWSDGRMVTSSDYIRAFQHLVAPDTASPRADLLNSVTNYDAVQSAKKPLDDLGLRKIDDNNFRIEFSKKDPEFLYKLSSTALYPTHPDHKTHIKNIIDFKSNGPYVVKNWSQGKEITLTPNPYYREGHPSRPEVKVLFIDDEMTAYRLYENNNLSFLRRIPAKLTKTLSERSDFFHQPMLRFDYIGFGETILKDENLRKALIYSVDYQKLKIILGALEVPGCPSIPREWLIKQKCFQFDLEKAKKALAQSSVQWKDKILHMKVSQLGGNDILQQAEFMQNQWKSHLGLNIQISQIEQKVFLEELRSHPPDIYRKGVGLDLPTCRNALQTFSEDSKQNYMNLDDEKYSSLISQMKPPLMSRAYRSLCSRGVDHLMDNHLIIPLGEMHFSLMAKPDFSGWTLNGLNQLDLSQLHPANKP